MNKLHITDWQCYDNQLEAFKRQLYSHRGTVIALENVPDELWSTVRDALFQRLKQYNVSALSLRNIPWTAADLLVLSKILKPQQKLLNGQRFIEDLDLSSNDWTDPVLLEALTNLLSHLPIKGLALAGCKFTENGMTALCYAVMQLVFLKTLNFSYNNLSGLLFERLNAFVSEHQTLRTLCLKCCQLETENDLKKLADWIMVGKLRVLNITGNFSKNETARRSLDKEWKKSENLQKLKFERNEEEQKRYAKIIRQRTNRIRWRQLQSWLKTTYKVLVLGFIFFGTLLSITSIVIGSLIVGAAWHLWNPPPKAPPEHPMPFEPLTRAHHNRVQFSQSGQSNPLAPVLGLADLRQGAVHFF